MDDHNPYAPSSASLDGKASRPQQDGSAETAWRNKKVLVMLPDSELPHRCIRCNEPSAEPTKVRKIYWHSPGWYLLIPVNIILYAIVALFVRKRALVGAGLCMTHKKRRRMRMIAAWSIFALGFVVMIMGFNNGAGNPALIVIGCLLLLFAVLFGMIGTRVLYAKRIETKYVWLKGCGAAFLDSLPPLP